MQPCDLSATEARALIGSKSLSPVELLESCLRRVEEVNRQVNGIVAIDRERAQREARDAERAVMRGEALGPLHGLPVAVKDLTLTAGVRTTFGSAAFAEYVPSVDADVVVLMRQAGLVSLGKTATSEFGLSLYAETDIAPAARNPWDTSCTAGGSSGGAAAAVAAGLVPFAQGNDGGGSLRIPASICGVVSARWA